MAWTYEITDGSPLNNCWKAFCELAQVLRARIILTDGDDTNAPVYELLDGSTSKAVTIADYERGRIRSYLLRDNAVVLRNAIMEKNTKYNCEWCDATGDIRYPTVDDIIEAVTDETEWLPSADYMKPAFWQQIFAVMSGLRYLFYHRDYTEYTGDRSYVACPTQTGDGATLADAWTDLLSGYSETPTGGTGGIGSIGHSISGRFESSVYYVSLIATVEAAFSDLIDMHTEASGTIIDSGYTINHRGPTGVSVVTDYSTILMTGSDEFYYENLDGAVIDLGDVEILPRPVTSTEIVFTPPLGVTPEIITTYVAPVFGSVLPFTGNTINKNRACWYLTDLGDPSGLA